MKKQLKFYDDELVIDYDETDELKDEVFQKLMGYFKKHKCFSGESIMQSDDPQIYAGELLSEICDDVIKFKETWIDDPDEEN